MNEADARAQREDDDEHWQQQMDEESREWEIMEALWAIHHGGFQNEAMLLASACGLGTQWKKEIELCEKQ